MASLSGDSRYNIGPAQTVLGVRGRRGDPAALEPVPLTWGMRVPSAEGPGRTHFVINARAESVAQRPAFREALDERRCVLPASGFYEWRRSAPTTEPWLFTLQENEPFLLAGLWNPAPADGTEGQCVVVTTAANERMRPIHDRMPVVLTADEARAWVGPAGGRAEERRRLLRPLPPERMKAARVSAFVSNVRNEGPGCIAPWDGPPAQEQTELPL